MDLSAYSDAAPTEPVNLLFIHHSVGGQLLADAGPAGHEPDDRRSIHRMHPNGGGLRTALATQGYRVHEAAYSSVVGEKTDLFDWLPKFATQMPRILSLRHQDERLAESMNQVVMFKSCYPNSAFRKDRTPGSPQGPDLTLSNARAMMSALREELSRYPDVLFVYLTAPPLRLRSDAPGVLKGTVRRLTSVLRPSRAQEQSAAAADARAFNDWLTSPTGWLKGYRERNLVAFDYFDVLTAGRASNFLRYTVADAADNHPSAQGQQIAAKQLAAFLNRAIRHAGIVDGRAA